MKHWHLGICYGLLLAGFTGYVMLDTFILPSGQTAATQINTEMFEQAQATTLAPTETTTAAEAATEARTGRHSHSTKPSYKPDDDGTVPDDVPAKPEHSAPPEEGSAPESTAPAEETQEDPAQPAGSPQEETPAPAQPPQGAAPQTETSAQPEPTVPEETVPDNSLGSYSDENISIVLTQYRENDTDIYVADVQLSSAIYLKTAFAEDTFGKNVTAATSEIAAAHGAVFAVNGDFCGARTSGYVIRNGVIYRDYGDADTDILCIYADGSFCITNSTEMTAQALVDAGVWQAFSFGPALVQDGMIAVSETTEVGQAMASNPRTVVGMISPLHYVFVVSDGRTSESAGLTLYQAAQFMQGLGCICAYNLDGGGSSTMYFQGQIINTPTTSGRSIKERSVSDIVYIGT